MIGLPKRRSKESRAAEHERKQQERAAKARKEADKAAEGGYKPAPEQDVLGWGHRGESPPD
ncbi:hypothetical protein [Streptomyces sp. NPDC001678]|uniref:hypothetical protein n=1 Tax=Streptomyces sp. NPDC001678 TaxID=3364599 RepID=UPI0036864762